MFEKIVQHVRDIAKLESTSALLEWDDHTYRPADAGEYRAEQVMILSEIIHNRRTDPVFGDMLRSAAADPAYADRSSAEGCTVQCLLEDFEKHSRLPVELVTALAKAVTLGQQAWVAARTADSWLDFKPHMEEIVRLRREEAQLLSAGGDAYDALLDEYEEGAKTVELTKIFAELRDGLVRLLEILHGAKNKPDGGSFKRPVNRQRQEQAAKWIAAQIGYDFARGRLDETAHPFCTTLGPDDCRILTRYDEGNLQSSFYGSLHEAGHGLYEQGLPREWFGLPPAGAAGLGVHESQSRLWENIVGRSHAFWQWCGPQLKKMFGSEWDGVAQDRLFADANLAEPSLIRVEADEVTYNLHILIRFELEQELVSGALSVADAPQAWNDRYERYLGIRPENYRDGILQDVHWSAGLIGYFPTYSLGNLYAAQLIDAARTDLGDLDAAFSRGEFQPLLGWMREHVHVHGRRFQPKTLVERAVGKPLSAAPLLNYLREKLEVAYGMV